MLVTRQCFTDSDRSAECIFAQVHQAIGHWSNYLAILGSKNRVETGLDRLACIARIALAPRRLDQQ
ncbi:transcriptional regulator [Novosphingobium sp. PY1]|nr:transcriptional regulator [Novosphingobium sp. PY1]